jgi:hypothetical protein
LLVESALCGRGIRLPSDIGFSAQPAVNRGFGGHHVLVLRDRQITRIRRSRGFRWRRGLDLRVVLRDYLPG